tara:strand:- start:17947 stop:18750 length:804 start_codon:yes stop_codon:yes gene_type:complete
MDIAVQLLAGHPFTINVRIEKRSIHEVLDSSSVTQNSGAENLQLPHPPALLLQEGGGELLLNRDSVISQLNLYGKNKKKRAKMPKTLLVWLIDLRQMDSQLEMVIQFLLGPVQRLFYEKKMGEDILWRKTISLVLENPILKDCLESTLFDGEPLSNKHYMVLLRAAKLSISSIDHELGRQLKELSPPLLKDKQASSTMPNLDKSNNTTAVRENADKKQNRTEIELNKTVTTDVQWPQLEETKPFDLRLEEVINRAIQKAPLKIEGDL